MTTHYNSASRGPIEIASMPFRHLQNAYDALCIREPHRDAEIAAMRARLAELQAEYDAAEAAKAATPGADDIEAALAGAALEGF